MIVFAWIGIVVVSAAALYVVSAILFALFISWAWKR